MDNQTHPEMVISNHNIPSKSENEIQSYFENFLQWNDPFFDLKVSDWEKERKDVYDKFRLVFDSSNLNQMTENDFYLFLDFNFNKSWTGLQRRGKAATSDMEKLKETIAYLQDESIDIKERIDEVLKNHGRYKIAGMGRNTVTALLHIFDSNKYGVWNNRAEGALIKLGLLPRKLAVSDGKNYLIINSILIDLKKRFDVNLTTVDMFMYYVDSQQKSPNTLTNQYFKSSSDIESSENVPLIRTSKVLNGNEAKKYEIENSASIEHDIAKETSITYDNSFQSKKEVQSNTNLNLNDNFIQKSQIGAASVGNINVNIHQKNYSWLVLSVLFLIVLFLLFVYLTK